MKPRACQIGLASSAWRLYLQKLVTFEGMRLGLSPRDSAA